MDNCENITKFEKFLNEYKNDENGVLIDVRTKEEYNKGHIPQSINIPLSDIEDLECDKSKKIYLYCHSGVRSEYAYQFLKEMGYNAVNIGGICLYQGQIEK